MPIYPPSVIYLSVPTTIYRAIRSLEVGPGCIFCVVSRVAGAPHIDALVLPRLEALCVLVLTGLLYCDCG